jgi:hypothetical protein
MIKKLTTVLQSELDKIDSSVKLMTSQDSPFKMNFDSWAFGKSNNRDIQVSSFIDGKELHLQLVDRKIIAAQVVTTDLSKIAFIVDCWLSKTLSTLQLKEKCSELQISEKYSNLLSLTVAEVLDKRWTNEYQRIIRGEIIFDADLFLALREKLSDLFPFFSHDNLRFSNILELRSENFKTPIIFCNNGTFEIGLTLNNSQSNNSFKTTSISEAIEKTIALLPINLPETRNPLA